MKTALKPELREAMVAGATAEAARIGVAQAVCITDDGGFPVVVDGAVVGGNGGQDIARGMAGLRVLAELLAPEGLAEPGIKR